MKFAAETNGTFYQLDTPVSVVIEQEADVPCDSLTAVFAYREDFPYIDRIYVLNDGIYDIKSAVENGNVIFSGIADETVLRYDSRKSEITVYARSLAALLTDSESSTVTYNDPSFDVIIREHAEPFGITKKENCDIKEKGGTFTVKKGSSHYRVIQRFCREFLFSTMRIDHTGRIAADIYKSGSAILFDNSRGVPFDGIKVCDNRYTKISEIKVYDEKGFCMSVKNPECEGTAIKRVRCLNLLESTGGSVSDADRIIKSSNNKSFTVQLDCPKCMINEIGSMAFVNAPWCENRLLYIQKIKYTFDKNGERTSVKLALRGDK